MTRKHSFPPVIDEHVRILILGSLPGELSLAHSQYYGNPQNRFWHFISDIVGQDVVQMTYPARLQALLDNGIGLWDVVAEAHRDGSLDSKIGNHSSNDLFGLLEKLPALTTIAFNGGTAARLGVKALQEHADRYRILRLPSSSPAYTLPYAEKLTAWRDLSPWLPRRPSPHTVA